MAEPFADRMSPCPVPSGQRPQFGGARSRCLRTQVDFLVINCSLFSPTPSLCAMACNKFKMRSGVRTYNLSGQGCSASLLSVDLASELLQNNPNSIAVVVSTEAITQSLYHGHAKVRASLRPHALAIPSSYSAHGRVLTSAASAASVDCRACCCRTRSSVAVERRCFSRTNPD